MDDLIARLKDTKTTVSATIGGIFLIVKELGFDITISQDRLETFALIALCVGVLLSGGKK